MVSFHSPLSSPPSFSSYTESLQKMPFLSHSLPRLSHKHEEENSPPLSPFYSSSPENPLCNCSSPSPKDALFLLLWPHSPQLQLIPAPLPWRFLHPLLQKLSLEISSRLPFQVLYSSHEGLILCRQPLHPLLSVPLSPPAHTMSSSWHGHHHRIIAHHHRKLTRLPTIAPLSLSLFGFVYFQKSLEPSVLLVDQRKRVFKNGVVGFVNEWAEQRIWAEWIAVLGRRLDMVGPMEEAVCWTD